jgi:RNA polymerase sigma factor (sigma-70 family)
MEINKLSNETINKYKPLVKSIARKYASSGEPTEDLEQIGYLGLLNAVQLFDKKKGVKFTTYATWLINGEIRHYIRDKYSMVKIPHWVRDYNRKIDRYVEKYRQKHSKFPTIDEISDQFNITREGIVEILKGRNAVQVISLDKEMRRREGDTTPIIENIKSKEYQSFQLPIEDVIHLKNIMRTLKKIHKQVIYYLFYKDLTQTTVAEKLGITQRQVSRIKHEAIEELRKNF